MKYILNAIGLFVILIVAAFVLELTDLGFFKFFEPKRENIRREVFEQTQSYVHGKIQELAKYYNEYQTADEDGKEVIRQVIIVQFAQFDVDNIDSEILKQFLVNMRGF